MRYRTLRLLAPLLLIVTLLTGIAPRSVAGQSAPAATYRTYLPLVAGGTGPASSPAPSDDGFTEVGWARTPYTSLAVGQVDGRTVARIRRYSEPTAYYDATSDSWLPIDTALIAAGGGYRNAAAGFSAQFAGGPGDSAIVRLGRPGEPTLAIAPPAGGLPAPIVGTDVITYPAALGDASLVYHSEPWGIKEEVVIAGPGAPSSYELRLDAPGLSVDPQDDGGYLLRNSQGLALWRVPAPTGSDASGATAPLSLRITPAGSSLLVRLEVDPAWLADPARAYPIRLDPSLVDPQYIGGDSYVQSAAPGIVSYKQRNRFIGYSNYQNALKGVTRIYTPVDLGVLPSGITPDQLLAARLVFTQYVAESGAGGFASSVYSVPSAWSDLTLTWNNQPAIGARIGGTQVSQALGQKRWDITAWAQSVLAGSAINNGLSIRADNESRGGGIFWSSHCFGICPDPTANWPYLELEVLLDSGLRPALDTWAWPNREGLPSFEQYARDYGVPATTHLVTETRVLKQLSATEVLSLPISLDALDIHSSIPLSVTAGLTSTETITPSQLIPRPISYLYEEVVVKAIYDDQFSAYYSAAMHGGLCVGMATTVADFYADGGPLPSAYGGADTVRSIPDTQQAQDFIQTYHGRQLSSAVLNWMAGEGRMSVSKYYSRLAARIGGAAWRADPEFIGIVKGSGCDDVEIGHALLPYKLVPMAGNRARVYVYDPNYPPTSDADAANHYIDLDLATGSWSYQLAPATATYPAVVWVGTELFSTPLHLISEKPVQPTSAGTDLIALEGGSSYAFGGSSYAFGGSSYAFGTDEELDTHTGCVAIEGQPITFMQKIARSMRITPLTGGSASVFPDAIFLPAGRATAFTGVGAKAGGIGDTMVFGPHGVIGYLTTAGANTRDTVRTDAAFLRASLSTNDPSKPASLYQIHETDAWTRVYALNNTLIDGSAPLVTEVSADLGSLTVINAGRPISYDLGFGHYGSDGVGQVIFPAQQIGANERRVYTPLFWGHLSDSPIRVDIDLGNDGTIDRVDLFGGHVVPAIVRLADVPVEVGGEIRLTAGDLPPGEFGWADIYHPLAPGELPAARGDGDQARDDQGGDTSLERMLRRWLLAGGAPELSIGSGLLGIPGRHADLARILWDDNGERRGILRPGDLVLVPLYDQILDGSRVPFVYRIGGFALVEILPAREHGRGDDHGKSGGAHTDCVDDPGDGVDDGAIRVRLVTLVAPSGGEGQGG